MAWEDKQYNRTYWENYTSTKSPINAKNLNNIEIFCDKVDNELIVLEAGKLNVSTANGMIKSIEIDTKTGVIKATQLDGQTYTWDFNVEKIPVSFSLSEDGILTMTTDDGTEYSVNISELIKDYVFDSSDTISVTKEYKDTDDSYHVVSEIKKGSINQEHVNPEFVANIQQSISEAKNAAKNAMDSANESERWAVGNEEDYPGSGTDNSKYYSEESKKGADSALESAEKAKDLRDEIQQKIDSGEFIGPAGKAATITVGTVTASEPGSDPQVTNSGTNSDAVFDFVLPRGPQGPAGREQIEFKSKADFPETGEDDKLYVDTSVDPSLIYRWDGEKYVLTGGSGGGSGTETGLYEYQGETTPSGRPPDPFAKASDVGDISELATEDKSSVVSAINEIYGKMENGGTSQVRIATFPSAGWTESGGVYTQTVDVADLLETGNYTYMLPSNLQTEEYIQAYESIIDNSFGAGTFTLTVSSIPSVDLQLVIGGVQSDAPYAAASDLVQTNANVAEVAAEVEGIKESAVHTDALWTNPTPTNDFEPQHIIIDDFTSYKTLIFLFYVSKSSNAAAPIYTVTTGRYQAIGIYSNKLCGRNISISVSDLTCDINVENGTIFNAYGEISSDNSVMIPYMIYGSK